MFDRRGADREPVHARSPRDRPRAAAISPTRFSPRGQADARASRGAGWRLQALLDPGFAPTRHGAELVTAPLPGPACMVQAWRRATSSFRPEPARPVDRRVSIIVVDRDAEDRCWTSAGPGEEPGRRAGRESRRPRRGTTLTLDRSIRSSSSTVSSPCAGSVHGLLRAIRFDDVAGPRASRRRARACLRRVRCHDQRHRDADAGASWGGLRRSRGRCCAHIHAVRRRGGRRTSSCAPFQAGTTASVRQAVPRAQRLEDKLPASSLPAFAGS